MCVAEIFIGFQDHPHLLTNCIICAFGIKPEIETIIGVASAVSEKKL